MPRVLLALSLLGAVFATVAPAQQSAKPPEGKVLKVLPLFVDKQGHHTVSPSLFDRDAYQAYLMKHPDKVTGIRYSLLWKAKRAEYETLTVRLELRGLYEEKLPALKDPGDHPGRTGIHPTLDGPGADRGGLRPIWEDHSLAGNVVVQRGNAGRVQIFPLVKPATARLARGRTWTLFDSIGKLA